jgi:hypothetical protein
MVFNVTFNNISALRRKSKDVAVIFIGGGNQSTFFCTWRKPPTCSKSLTTLSHKAEWSTPHHELDLSSR